MTPSFARVIFDEAHREAWTIRPELARSMQAARLKANFMGVTSRLGNLTA